MFCKECGAEIVPGEDYCRQCGVNVNETPPQPVSALQPCVAAVQSITKEENQKPMTASRDHKALKFAVIVLLSVFAATLVFTYISTSRIKTIHNTSLGYTISLGMSKEKIDKLAGAPVEMSGYYIYSGGLGIQYLEGKASVITATKSNWSTVKGLNVTQPLENVFLRLGDEDLSRDGSVYYQYNFWGFHTPKIKNARYIVGFTQEGGRIGTIMVFEK